MICFLTVFGFKRLTKVLWKQWKKSLAELRIFSDKIAATFLFEKVYPLTHENYGNCSQINWKTTTGKLFEISLISVLIGDACLLKTAFISSKKPRGQRLLSYLNVSTF